MNRKQRQRLFKKYGGRCAYCGVELPKRWHADHIEPIRRNPDGSMEHPERHGVIENYNPSCPSCNIMKSSETLENFRHKVARFINSLNEYSTQYQFAKRYGLIEETKEDVTFYFERYEE